MTSRRLAYIYTLTKAIYSDLSAAISCQALVLTYLTKLQAYPFVAYFYELLNNFWVARLKLRVFAAYSPHDGRPGSHSARVAFCLQF